MNVLNGRQIIKKKLQEIDKTWTTKKRKSFQIKLNEKENIQ